ncbi:MAG: transcription elongation factor GreB [Bdellovibrionales bacterium]
MKSYITKNGFEGLRADVRELIRVERPKVVEIVSWAAGNGDRSENGDYIYGKRRLREIDRRVEYLVKKLERVEVVDPLEIESKKIVFGATVSLVKEDGRKVTYQIVGEDETDVDKLQISWKSPMAKALLGKQVGDEVELRSPRDVEYLEILAIRYI